MERKLYPRNSKLIGFKNVARDFEQDFVFLGKTKSGRMKLGEISGDGPDGFTVYKNRLTKIEKVNGKTRHRVYEGGSAFNTYFRDE